MNATKKQQPANDRPEEQKMRAWKAAWLNANRCYKGLRTNLWRLTKILNEVFDDAEFRADNGLRDDVTAADWIDSRLSELPIGYMELRTILTYYPDRASWEGAKLSKLRESIKPAKTTRPAKPRAAKLDANQLKRERDFYAAKAKCLQRQLAAETTPAEATTGEAAQEKSASFQANARPASTNDTIETAMRLLALLEAGIDYEDAELMRALDRLAVLLNSVFSMETV